MNTRHVPDLEHCQELDRLCKEKGIVVPETEFVWRKAPKVYADMDFSSVTERGKEDHYYEREHYQTFPAPLVSEQGEWLWNIFEEHNWDLLYKAYGEVFNFKGTQRIGELGIINLMKRPNMGIKMLNYLLAEGIITTL